MYSKLIWRYVYIKLESRIAMYTYTGLIYIPILREINTEYSLEGLMLKLKLQYFGHLVQKANSLEKTLMLGKMRAGREGDKRG